MSSKYGKLFNFGHFIISDHVSIVINITDLNDDKDMSDVWTFDSFEKTGVCLRNWNTIRKFYKNFNM